MSITFPPTGTPNHYNVMLGKREIGSVMLFTIRGESAWRFLARRKDIAARSPIPANKHATAEACMAEVRELFGVKTEAR